MISPTQGAPSAKETRWNIFNVFSSAASAAKNVFDFQDENVDEFSLIIRPGLLSNFSREIRMLQETFGGASKNQASFQQDLIKYAFRLIEQARMPDQKNPEQAVLHAKTIIAKIIFLADRDMKHLEEIVLNTPSKNYEMLLNEYVQNHVAIQALQIKINRETQDILKIQSGKNSDVNLVTEIAKLVVTNNGVINAAIADSLLKEMNCSAQVDETYTYLHLIHDLLCNEELNATFNAILGPEKEESLTYDLIRCILGLKSDETVTHAHAKQAILSAMMIVFCNRKYPSPSKLHHYMQHVLSFCSYLIRTGQGLSLDAVPEDPALSIEFNMRQDGSINDSSTFVWGLPGLIAAARQLGINNLQSVWEEFKQHFSFTSEATKMSVSDFIEKLVAYAISKNPSLQNDAKQLLQFGKLAFSSFQFSVLADLTTSYMKGEKKRVNDIVQKVALKRIFRSSRPVMLEVNGLTIDEAVQKLAAHSKAVANINVNEDMRLNMFEFVYANMIPESIQPDFHTIVREYNRSILHKSHQQPVSVKEYAMKILELANELTDANEQQRYENQKALSSYLLYKGVDENLREGLWNLALPIQIPNSPYKFFHFDFYLMHDLLNDQLVRVAANKSGTQVEIIENWEWDNVMTAV